MRQVDAGEPLLELQHGGRRRWPWSRRSRACRTRCRCTRSCRGGRGSGVPESPSASSPAMSGSTSVLGDVEDDELLVRSRAQAASSRATRADRRGAVERRTGDASDDRRHADEEAAVLLPVHADVVAVRRRLRRRGTVGQRVAEVLVLQHLAELLGAPLGEQELQARLVAQAPVAVVAEDLRDAVPRVGHLVGCDEDAESLAEPRGCGERAADPQVVADAELGVVHGHERHVVDLVHDVLAGVPGDRGLELAGEVGQRLVADEAAGDLVDLRGRVDELVGRDAGDRRAEDHAGHVAARLGGAEPDRFEPAPDLGHVLDADPVQLDVLAVGQVGGARGRTRSRCSPMTRSCSVVSWPPSMRTRSMKYSSSSSCGSRVAVLPPSMPGLRCVYRPHQRKRPCRSVGSIEAKPPCGVDVLDALADRQAAVGLLPLLVAVERGLAVDLPLPVGLGRRPRGTDGGVLAAGLWPARADVAESHGGPSGNPGVPGADPVEPAWRDYARDANRPIGSSRGVTLRNAATCSCGR